MDLTLLNVKKTFMDICNQVMPLMSKHDTKNRKVILVEIKVLWEFTSLHIVQTI
jgi:hypothetical protein